MKGFKLATSALLSTLTLAASPAANAMLMLEITDQATNTSVTVKDTDGDGKIYYSSFLNGPLNNWFLDFSTGKSSPAIGTQSVKSMSLFSGEISGGLGTLTIKLTDTGFDKFNAPFTANARGATDGEVLLQSFLNASNTQDFGTETLISDSGVIAPTSGAGDFSFSDRGSIVANSIYSLTTVITITHDDSGQISYLNHAINVPEPASLALLGLGLVGMGMVGRNRRRLKSATA